MDMVNYLNECHANWVMFLQGKEEEDNSLHVVNYELCFVSVRGLKR